MIVPLVYIIYIEEMAIYHNKSLKLSAHIEKIPLYTVYIGEIDSQALFYIHILYILCRGGACA